MMMYLQISWADLWTSKMESSYIELEYIIRSSKVGKLEKYELGKPETIWMHPPLWSASYDRHRIANCEPQFELDYL